MASQWWINTKNIAQDTVCHYSEYAAYVSWGKEDPERCLQPVFRWNRQGIVDLTSLAELRYWLPSVVAEMFFPSLIYYWIFFSFLAVIQTWIIDKKKNKFIKLMFFDQFLKLQLLHWHCVVCAALAILAAGCLPTLLRFCYSNQNIQPAITQEEVSWFLKFQVMVGDKKESAIVNGNLWNEWYCKKIQPFKMQKPTKVTTVRIFLDFSVCYCI